jgi:NAD(P)-dependent dehydrogenase (short-subunit alcohol dehydrogenase family)
MSQSESEEHTAENDRAALTAAVVVGVGPTQGLGAALCRRFAEGGLHVFAAGRTQAKLDDVVAQIEDTGGAATAVVTDTTQEADVLRLFDAAQQVGRIEAVLYNAGNNRPGDLRDMEASFFEETWRLSCLGGFLVGREAARRMGHRLAKGTAPAPPTERRSLLFTGATASMRGKPPFSAFASAKAGLRSLAQSLARELGPEGVHVAHVVVDGGISGDKLVQHFPHFVEAKGEGGMLDLEALAEVFWQLHLQHHTVWTQELDVRPFREAF